MKLCISLFNGGGFMSRYRDNAELLADRASLPTDAVCGAVKLTVYGRRRALIENHNGIIDYEEDLIIVDCGAMRISIRGDELTLTAMNKNDMLIRGRLLSIEFE